MDQRRARWRWRLAAAWRSHRGCHASEAPPRADKGEPRVDSQQSSSYSASKLGRAGSQLERPPPEQVLLNESGDGMKVYCWLFAVILASGAETQSRPCGAVLQWRWDGNSRDAERPVVGGYLVAQLNDDDGNGRIDPGDVADVLVGHYSSVSSDGRITALDGRTGVEMFTTDPLVPVDARHHIAAADLDADGTVELLAVHANRQQLVAFDHMGITRWVGAPLAEPEFAGAYALAVADLDQDGSPEIYTGPFAFGAEGSLKWKGTASRGGRAYHSSMAGDITATSPGMEVLAGNTLYDSGGGIIWENETLQDGYSVMADCVGDGDAEIVLVERFRGTVHLLDMGGSDIVVPCVASNNGLSPALVADIDADGKAEIVVGDRIELIAVEWSGVACSVMWRHRITIGNHASIQVPVAYDFDGDGASEVLYCDDEACYVLDGRTGSVRESIPEGSDIPGAYPSPMIADLDNDCHANIIVGGFGLPSTSGSFAVYGCSEGVEARRIWNMFGYHAVNIDDDGTVPQYETPVWRANNSCIGQVARDDGIPEDIGNTLFGIRNSLNVVLSWSGPNGGVASYTLHRGTEKGVWPSPPFMPGLAAPSATLPDVQALELLYFYRVAGANCAGVEGP